MVILTGTWSRAPPSPAGQTEEQKPPLCSRRRVQERRSWPASYSGSWISTWPLRRCSCRNESSVTTSCHRQIKKYWTWERDERVPVSVGAVQIQPHSFTSSYAGKSFNFQNLRSDESLVENRQPIILKEDTWQLKLIQYETKGLTVVEEEFRPFTASIDLFTTLGTIFPSEI